MKMNLNNDNYYQHHLVTAWHTHTHTLPRYASVQYLHSPVIAANAEVRCAADGGACWSPQVYRESSPASASPGGNTSFLRMGA